MNRELPVTQGVKDGNPVQVCAKIHRLSKTGTQRDLNRTWQRHRETGEREAHRGRHTMRETGSQERITERPREGDRETEAKRQRNRDTQKEQRDSQDLEVES